MASLFDALDMGGLALSNRVVMAPLTRNRSPNAVPSEMVATYYQQRASAGLIVSEGVAISHQGQGYADVPGLYSPEQLEGWRKVTEAVHAKGGKIVAQLWHVGRVSHVQLQPEGGAPVAPSALTAKTKTFLLDGENGGQFVATSAPRALALEELTGIVADYAKAAKAAISAGFDGVEIHAANGYLIDQFLRSSSNHRDDAYGGEISNRVRFLEDVVAAVSQAIGGARTGIRISPVTPANDVADEQPALLFDAVVKVLAQYNLAFIHVIEGSTGMARDYYQGEGPFDYAALKQAYREVGGTGAWIVNNAYTGEMAEAAVASGYADAVSFGRAFISNPDLVNRLKMKLPLAASDRRTYYGGGAEGYVDYPDGEVSQKA